MTIPNNPKKGTDRIAQRGRGLKRIRSTVSATTARKRIAAIRLGNEKIFFIIPPYTRYRYVPVTEFTVILSVGLIHIPGKSSRKVTVNLS